MTGKPKEGKTWEKKKIISKTWEEKSESHRLSPPTKTVGLKRAVKKGRSEKTPETEQRR